MRRALQHVEYALAGNDVEDFPSVSPEEQPRTRSWNANPFLRGSAISELDEDEERAEEAHM